MLLAFNGLEPIWYVLFGLALLVPAFFRVVKGWDISLVEFPIIAIIVLFAIWCTLAVGRGAQMTGHETWSGKVTGKERVWASCNHCTDICDANGENCVEDCDHTHDWRYVVETTLGNHEIARRGATLFSTAPKAWSEAQAGDPVAKRRAYTNYLLGIGEDRFEAHHLVEQYRDQLPRYPGKIYDHYKIDRVMTKGVHLPDEALWNEEIALIQKRLGPEKQANVIIVMTDVADPNYVHALEQHWLGGNKNDVIVVMGVTNTETIAWTRIIALNTNDDFEPRLETALMEVGSLDRDRMISTIDQIVFEDFKRLPMGEFEELKYQIEPPLWARVAGVLLAWLAAFGASILMHRVEIGGSIRKFS